MLNIRDELYVEFPAVWPVLRPHSPSPIPHGPEMKENGEHTSGPLTLTSTVNKSTLGSVGGERLIGLDNV